MTTLTPEQQARRRIDRQLEEAGWIVQSMSELNPAAGRGVAVREYPTDSGPMDYLLMVDHQAVGVIEAKRDDEGHRLNAVELQSARYATSSLKHLGQVALRFVHEATGEITRYTDSRDPKPRAREVFQFPRPDTLAQRLKEPETLRARLTHVPTLQPHGLRDCQLHAITNLEQSLGENRPRALIQMATGAGKTFTAITSIYRLLKFSQAKRVLFLVDTKNLGEQAEGEFHQYIPQDDNRKFTELYTVRRLTSSHIPDDAQVIICTIQRLYSILKGEPLDEATEETVPDGAAILRKPPLPVIYNARIPPEFFEFMVIDECHRSIYNLWRQVLEYFDSFLIGLTATPDNRTYGFFQQNVVSEYTLEQSVADGVNVDHRVWRIDTEITQAGGRLEAEELVEKRERLSRKKRWEQLDQEIDYQGTQLDRSVVNPSQIRTVIQAFRDGLPQMFPDRVDDDGAFQVPKTLIFAKTDSHADDIIRIVREEFGEGNEFCKKITYRIDEDPKSVLASFRNDYHPRIAVTVDMIATGTDVKPLECLLFMRDVKSRNYYMQMVGRGTRSLDADGLAVVSNAARGPKQEFILVDAIGVKDSQKKETGSLEKTPSYSQKDLMNAVTMGVRDEEVLSSLSGRFARFAKRLDAEQQRQVKDLTGGASLNDLAGQLLKVDDPDAIDAQTRKHFNLTPNETITSTQWDEVRKQRAQQACAPITGPLNTLLEDIRERQEQTLDTVNIDTVTHSGWDRDLDTQRAHLRQEFEQWLQSHRDDITALTIYYAQPQRRAEITQQTIAALLESLKQERPRLAPVRIWDAYAALDDVQVKRPEQELAQIVALVRRACGWDDKLTPYADTVRANFKKWIFARHAGNQTKFSPEQQAWLEMIRDHIAVCLHLEVDDLDYIPFNEEGGAGKMYQLFGDEMDRVIDEINDALAA
ncbi:type III restriction enzyme, res subunit [Chromohalobacter israelensis DSM 3043]|uniref:Type III restriction enzyme, res subunit n=2 Tax=Chromohalobacter israelensis TaxID=141390 RepID=Q1R1F7_CHRI1|nr:type III restriction enzyme, res subunit [Chromohalobacter salexigens DSM 3043]